MSEPAADVVSVEEYLEELVADADRMLAGLAETRDRLAINLHGLRMARDPRVAEAVADYERRVAENDPYTDGLDIDEVYGRIQSARPKSL